MFQKLSFMLRCALSNNSTTDAADSYACTTSCDVAATSSDALPIIGIHTNRTMDIQLFLLLRQKIRKRRDLADEQKMIPQVVYLVAFAAIVTLVSRQKTYLSSLFPAVAMDIAGKMNLNLARHPSRMERRPFRFCESSLRRP